MFRDGLGQLVDGQLGARKGVAGGRDYAFRLAGVKRIPSGCVGGDDTADSAPVRIGSTAAGSRWDSAARAERRDQGSVLPQRALHVGAGRAGEEAADRELGGGEQMSAHGGDRPGASHCGRLTSARSSLHRAT